MKRVYILLCIFTLSLLIYGSYFGLKLAPPDIMMGDVQRIMYVHVPSAWMALLAFTTTLVSSVLFLIRKDLKWDALAQASAETGVFFNALLIALGSIWGKPTWGIWWTWDPRLTTAAIMLLAFSGYLIVRQFIESEEQRAQFAAVIAVIAYLDLPLVWFSVRFWRGLHQIQSSPKTVDAEMVTALRLNAFAFLGYLILVIWRRFLDLRHRQQKTVLEYSVLAGSPQIDNP